MKKIPTHIHGLIDYGLAGVVAASPGTLGFPEEGRGRHVARMAAIGTLATSALTDYEWGMFRKIPMKFHLAMDVGRAGFVAASPWILGFKTRRKRSWLPHLLIGSAFAAMTLLTHPRPRRLLMWKRRAA